MQYSINSDISNVKELASALHTFCEKQDVDSVIARQAELILVEAINNIIIHSYKREAGNTITAEFDKNTEHILIRLTDQGMPIPDSALNPDRKLPEAEGLPEGGWGLALIMALADNIHYQHGSDKNVLSIKKNLEPEPVI